MISSYSSVATRELWHELPMSQPGLALLDEIRQDATRLIDYFIRFPTQDTNKDGDHSASKLRQRNNLRVYSNTILFDDENRTPAQYIIPECLEGLFTREQFYHTICLHNLAWYIRCQETGDQEANAELYANARRGYFGDPDKIVPLAQEMQLGGILREWRTLIDLHLEELGDREETVGLAVTILQQLGSKAFRGSNISHMFKKLAQWTDNLDTVNPNDGRTILVNASASLRDSTNSNVVDFARQCFRILGFDVQPEVPPSFPRGNGTEPQSNGPKSNGPKSNGPKSNGPKNDDPKSNGPKKTTHRRSPELPNAKRPRTESNGTGTPQHPQQFHPPHSVPPPEPQSTPGSAPLNVAQPAPPPVPVYTPQHALPPAPVHIPQPTPPPVPPPAPHSAPRPKQGTVHSSLYNTPQSTPQYSRHAPSSVPPPNQLPSHHTGPPPASGVNWTKLISAREAVQRTLGQQQDRKQPVRASPRSKPREQEQPLRRERSPARTRASQKEAPRLSQEEASQPPKPPVRASREQERTPARTRSSRREAPQPVQDQPQPPKQPQVMLFNNFSEANKRVKEKASAVILIDEDTPLGNAPEISDDDD
uniref:ARAD1C15180p n=1 Tax=Blastobotrys adeninivorans TaxID=409370 RepID=A0A060T5U6_BLAAD